jgi:hypothetical protein
MAREEGIRIGRKEGQREVEEEVSKLKEFLLEYRKELEEKGMEMIRLDDEKHQVLLDKQFALDEIEYLKSQLDAERNVHLTLSREVEELTREVKKLR